MDTLKLNSKLISLATSEDGTKTFGKVLICPLDESNLNGKGIKKSDLSETELKSLIEQPVVCKVIKNDEGLYDFKGHELKKIQTYNVQTKQIETKYYFDTNPIGFFSSSEIEELDIDGIKKYCIVANIVLWNRYENAIEACNRLYNEDNLHVSYELTYADSYTEDEIIWLKGITFIGVAVLGSNVSPAYPIAGIIELSSLDENEKVLAEAFTEDLIAISALNIKQEEGGNGGMPENKTTTKDVASVTMNDLYEKVSSAINSTDRRNYYYISRIYPYDYRAIAYIWDRESEDDYIEFTYVVNSDDTISVTAQKDIKMVFIAKETLDTQTADKDKEIATLKTQLTDKETELSTKTDALIKAGEDLKSKETIISQKDEELATLKPFKEEHDKVEAEKQAQELAEKKNNLKALATKGGYITAEELETAEDLKSMIENLDEKGIKAVIAERVIKKLDETPSNIETSTKDPEVASANINNDDEQFDGSTFMSSWLKSK